MATDDDGIAFLADFFAGKNDGYLVDVGAHDGVADGSMTRDLIARGWGGMMIEPLPEAFDKLKAAYAGNPRVTCLNLACSASSGHALLYPCLGVSTIEPGWAKACEAWWSHVRYGTPVQVNLEPLAGLLARHAPKQIDLLQIDTEGHDHKVLLGMDWTYAPAVVCIETLDMLNPVGNGKWRAKPETDAMLKAHGYRHAMDTAGGNAMYVRERP